MATTEPLLTGECPASLRHRRLIVRWRASVSGWADARWACGGRGHGQVELACRLELMDGRCALVECWMELPGRREVLVSPQTAPCAVCVDGRLLHVDVQMNGESAISLTIDQADWRLLYARSALRARSGFGTGSFDPPSVEIEAVVEEAASA